MVTAVRWTALPTAGCLPSVVGSVDGWPTAVGRPSGRSPALSCAVGLSSVDDSPLVVGSDRGPSTPVSGFRLRQVVPHLLHVLPNFLLSVRRPQEEGRVERRHHPDAAGGLPAAPQPADR